VKRDTSFVSGWPRGRESHLQSFELSGPCGENADRGELDFQHGTLLLKTVINQSSMRVIPIRYVLTQRSIHSRMCPIRAGGSFGVEES